MNKALDLLREIRPSIPKEVLELWCKDRDAFLASHPAVEQAGGDERAAFEQWLEQHMSHHFSPEFDLAKYEDSGEYRYNPAADYWKAWQARAALAQPSPVSEALIYACKNLAQITSSDGSGHADIAMAVLRMAGVGDDERERLVNEWKAARAWKPSPAQAEGAPVVGCLCGMPMTEGHHSQDGCCNLEEFAPQAQAEQAEAERPEVVGQLVTWPTGQRYVGRVRERKVCKTEDVMTVAQHAASVARWAEMFNRVEQERDAALVEVNRLRESKGDPSGSFDRCMRMMYERDENAKRLDAALARVAELDKQCRDDVARALGLRPSQERGFAWSYLLASIKSCVKASEDAAQAQHSVPEGVTIERDVVGTIHIKVGDFDFIQLQYQRPYTDNASTWKLAERIASLLAAAPGKEVGHE
ncbi:hypothetical protein [Pseudomonas aeruginosa]|uniref:hypothetical protein n=1 Tax=Pseudomonas aeruginosa TaxID=287 RepID=UPI002498D576|nr:hypothetical protein [Pseudomonas aeruginosa]MDI2345931.1 hypothetical protein [Pseudomonas aeruginosa]